MLCRLSINEPCLHDASFYHQLQGPGHAIEGWPSIHKNEKRQSYSRSSSAAAHIRHYSSGCVGGGPKSDKRCVSLSLLAMISSYLLCNNRVARCIVAQSLGEMASEIKMRSDSDCRHWKVSLTNFLLTFVKFEGFFRCISCEQPGFREVEYECRRCFRGRDEGSTALFLALSGGKS